MDEPILKLQASTRTLLLRSDYSDDVAWAELCRMDFRAYPTFVDNPVLAERALSELMAVAESGGYESLFFIAGRQALSSLSTQSWQSTCTSSADGRFA